MAEALFADFEAATLEDWREAARASLRGRLLESLVSRSYEGIDIHPLIGADVLDGIPHLDSLPGQFPFLRGTTGAGYRARPWLIAQDIDIAEPDKFNAALRDALANGQTAITLNGNLQLNESGDLQRALAEIDLRPYPLFVRSDWRAPEIYQLIRAAFNEDVIRQLSGCAGYDPLADLARSGWMGADAFERMHRHAQATADFSPQLGSVSIGSYVYHGAGANAVQELAIVLATAAEYLRTLGERGLDLDLVASNLQVVLGIGENFFVEVAKFRAVKLLWAQMLRAFGVGAEGQRIRLHARSGRRNKTRRDPHVNLLRLTTEALSAAIGGVEGMTIAPFDEPLGKSDEFSRRLSRNLQLILQAEMELTQLIDPAGGAWAVEMLTDELARRAWEHFQAIEAAGGMVAALQAGTIQAEIEAVAEHRRRDVASGEAILVGCNKYVDADEVLPELQPPAQVEVARQAAAGDIRVKPLKPLRLAEPFEAPPESGIGA